MRITFLSSESFCASIATALANPPDVESSVNRIQRSLNRLPNGSLVASKRGQQVLFFTKINGKQKYLPKKSNAIYPLLRRRYQSTLLEILQLTESHKVKDIVRREKLIMRLQDFIRLCDEGNLMIEKIVLTNAQKEWFLKPFDQKVINPDTAIYSANGLPLRSKSERDIIDSCDAKAVPLHYEERMYIKVHHLVNKLEQDLMNKNLLNGPLFSFRNHEVYWNVPSELGWMNARGSIWKTYYPPTGTIKIYNDIRSMLADSNIFVWEHAGLMEAFLYRTQATERSTIMLLTDSVSRDNYLETFERDVDTAKKRDEMIDRFILPRLWF